MRRRSILLASVFIAIGGAAQVAAAAAPATIARPAEDIARDAARKPADMVTFAHIGAGSKVADFLPGHGYFSRVFATAVKPGGNLVAIVPAGAVAHDPAARTTMDAIAAQYGDVTVVSGLTDPAAHDLDVFWTAQNYHDLHDALPPEGVIATNKAIFAALKPGGYYVVIDHAAAAGSGLAATNTLHRIDPAVVKAEVLAAGFVLDGESTLLVNPNDPHTANVFDPSVRGKTDQFAYRFKKPR